MPHITPARPTDLDADLVHAVLDGDTSAFDELYRRYRPRLVATLTARTGDASLAQDLSHETLLRALDRLNTFDGTRPLWPWLRRIAINISIDAARRRGAPTAQLDEAGTPSPSDAFDALQDRWTLDLALASVAPRQRNALVLRYLYGYDSAEAARHMGLARGAFDQLLFRARAALRREYERLTEDGSIPLLLPLWLGWQRVAARLRGRARVALRQVASGASSMASTVGEPAVAVVMGVSAMVAPVAAMAQPPRPPAVDARVDGPAAADRPSATARTGKGSLSSERPLHRPAAAAPASRRAVTPATAETAAANVSTSAGDAEVRTGASVGRQDNERRTTASGRVRNDEKETGNETVAGANCDAGLVGATSCAALDAGHEATTTLSEVPAGP